MKTQIVMAKKHGAKESVMLCGPEVPIAEQLKKVKSLKQSRVNVDYESVSVFEQIKINRFESPAAVKARAEFYAKQKAAAEKAAEAAEKAVKTQPVKK